MLKSRSRTAYGLAARSTTARHCASSAIPYALPAQRIPTRLPSALQRKREEENNFCTGKYCVSHKQRSIHQRSEFCIKERFLSLRTFGPHFTKTFAQFKYEICTVYSIHISYLVEGFAQCSGTVLHAAQAGTLLFTAAPCVSRIPNTGCGRSASSSSGCSSSSGLILHTTLPVYCSGDAHETDIKAVFAHHERQTF